jgi:hypothetical protein
VGGEEIERRSGFRERGRQSCWRRARTLEYHVFKRKKGREGRPRRERLWVRLRVLEREEIRR